MDFLKIARSIVSGRRVAQETGAPSEVKVMAVMSDGSGVDVDYEVECSVDTFDVQKVTRVDTAQEVDPEAFKIMYGKTALDKLAEEAAEQAGEIEAARDAEELGGEPAAPAAGPPSAAPDEGEEPDGEMDEFALGD